MSRKKRIRKISPVKAYDGVRYPTVQEMKQKARQSAPVMGVAALLAGLSAFTGQQANAEDAQWTLPPLPDDIIIRQPAIPMIYSSACAYGPFYDSDDIVESVTFVNLNEIPTKYLNEIIKIEGILSFEPSPPLSKSGGLLLTDYDDNLFIWLMPRSTYPIVINQNGIGKRVTVVGEFKYYTERRFVPGDGFVYEDGFGLEVRGYETHKQSGENGK